MRNQNHQLTRRHLQILHLMARGLTSEETAKRLGIDAKTVATHRAGMLLRLGAQNAPHAIWLAMRRGLIR
ncbi:MAG TPA: helix-turn-helix transcriptional regulator [Planctomycetota bacterium]|jgi:DNA-binding CsgD family transcriptional regulator